MYQSIRVDEHCFQRARHDKEKLLRFFSFSFSYRESTLNSQGKETFASSSVTAVISDPT